MRLFAPQSKPKRAGLESEANLPHYAPTMKPRYRSCIPKEARAVVTREYRRDGASHWLKEVEYYVGTERVGTRHFGENDTLEIETPFRRGKIHGTRYYWHDGVNLELAEPFVDGRMHGTARQWDMDGILLGTYTMVHGVGLDIWRQRAEDGTVYVSEIHSSPEGVELWVNEDQRSVWSERFWKHGGLLHGVERDWNEKGRLCRGFPKYHVMGKQVDKRAYLRACLKDPTLPRFRLADNDPRRVLPIPGP